MYRPNRLVYNLLGRWLVSTPYFTLPNLIAGKRILREFIPHFGGGEELAVEVIRLLRQPGYADDQRLELDRVVKRFEGRVAARAAADAIESVAGLRPAAGSGSAHAVPAADLSHST
jgi:lipid-A-disaccharide synthase